MGRWPPITGTAHRGCARPPHSTQVPRRVPSAASDRAPSSAGEVVLYRPRLRIQARHGWGAAGAGIGSRTLNASAAGGRGDQAAQPRAPRLWVHRVCVTRAGALPRRVQARRSPGTRTAGRGTRTAPPRTPGAKLATCATRRSARLRLYFAAESSLIAAHPEPADRLQARGSGAVRAQSRSFEPRVTGVFRPPCIARLRET